ncbi:MAG: endonuclease/exonuclease/phosphatase family protein [Bacteroidota bacterium]
MRRPLPILLALALLLPLTSCDSSDGPTGSIVAMSLNLYLGADIFVLTQEPNPNLVPVRVAEVYGAALASDFTARAESIADAIQAEDPDLIGLQEVTTYATQTPSDYVTGTTEPNATNVTVDFLDILLDALAARGLDYRVASTSNNADVEFPATTDGQSFFDVRYRDADVILARSDVQTSGAVENSFNALVTVPVGGVDQTFVRGYQHVTATIDDFTFTFVNTHLEVGGDAAPIQFLQATQLKGVIDRLDGPVAFTGDINSAADGSTTDSYAKIIEALTDPLAGGGEPTCCQDSDLLNATSDHTTRIDFVMHRDFEGATDTRAILDTPDTRVTTAGGTRWATDHAGVVSTLTY